MNNSFWNIPDITNIKTPTVILKEQGSALSEATKGLLHGIVKITPTSGTIYLKMEIIVPALNNYKYTILEYTHPMMSSYPGELTSRFETNSTMIENEFELLDCLKEILSSNDTKKVLEGLMLQAASAST